MARGARKTGRKAGSKLLGEELRRLRGKRRLEDIAELTRQSPLASRVRPVSVPTLSQVENGAVQPNPDTLYALAVVYQVSLGHLYNLMAEDRIVSGIDLPGDHEETKRRLHSALTAGRWHEALAHAIHGERHAPTAAEEVRWRAHRAVALAKLGMRQDAISLLMECSDSPVLPRAHLPLVLTFLADALADAGHLDMAGQQATRAWQVAGDEAAPSLRLALLQSRIRLTTARHAAGLPVAETEAREALRLVAQARAMPEASAETLKGRLGLYEAQLQECLGNDLIAVRDYARLAARFDADGQPLLAMFAWHDLGALRRRQDRLQEAHRCLVKAENRAVELKQYDEAFQTYFELYLVADALGDGRSDHYFARCERYLPLVERRTVAVRQFEQLLREGARP